MLEQILQLQKYLHLHTYRILKLTHSDPKNSQLLFKSEKRSSQSKEFAMNHIGTLSSQCRELYIFLSPWALKRKTIVRCVFFYEKRECENTKFIHIITMEKNLYSNTFYIDVQTSISSSLASLSGCARNISSVLRWVMM